MRTWLLRKNYTNLRDAARTLQVAWRERRSTSAARRAAERPQKEGVAPFSAPSDDREVGGNDSLSRCDERERSAGASNARRQSGSSSTGCDGSSDAFGSDMCEEDVEGVAEVGSVSAGDCLLSNTAAATLQRATRGMLARKSFRRVKRQAMASLVIQKSLFMWWVHKGSVQS